MDSDEEYLSSSADERVDSEEEEGTDAYTEDQRSDDYEEEGTDANTEDQRSDDSEEEGTDANTEDQRSDDSTEDQRSDDSAQEGEGEGDADEGEGDDDAEVLPSQPLRRSRRKMTKGKGEGDADAEVLPSHPRCHSRRKTTKGEGEGDADAEVLPSQPLRRPRRKRTITKWPEDKIVVTELTEDGTPKEKAAKARMRRLAGLIARQRISLVLASFNVLTDEDKMDLFDDCVQPKLEFAEELRERACKKMMQMVAKCWRTHKSHLVSNYVSKGLDATVKHTYIRPEVWEDFVILKQGELAKKESMRFKKLRERNKHDHHLGTGGYAGKLAQWEQEDKELADARIANPWDQFPGRSRNFMRARGRLVISEGVAVIDWETKEAENLAHEVVNKQAEIDSSGARSVREKDVLTQALGRPEQTGRIRGMSSSSGWKFWPLCTDMYRKRKQRSDDVDMEAIKEQLANEITEKVTEKVTNEIMARLCAAGVNLDLLSNIPSIAGGKNVQLDRKGGISGQVSPSPCTLVIINPEGYQVEVATGRVFPNILKLYSIPVEKGYVVVHIDSVVSEHGGHVLLPCSSNEIRTLGDALYKRIQWRREWVVVSQRASYSISAKHPTPPTPWSAKSRNVLVGPKVPPSLNEKANVNSPAQNCASMEHVGNKQKKLKNTKPLTAPRLPPSSEQEYLDLPCTLVIINRRGYQVEVAKGRVFPNNSMINRVPVEEGYVVVLIEFVCPGEEGHALLWCQSKDARTLGGAMYKRIQWKRDWVVVSPQFPSISAKPQKPMSARSYQNVLVEPKVSPFLIEKENDSTTKGDTKLQVQKVGDKEKQQRRSSKAAKVDTKQVEEAVDKPKRRGVKEVVRKQSVAQHTKLSEHDHFQFQSNPDFLFGQPMLPITELDKAGPGCVALHAYYMKACAQNRSSPFSAMVKSKHFFY